MMDVEDVIKGRSGSKGNARGFQIPSGARAKGAENIGTSRLFLEHPGGGAKGLQEVPEGF